jgi:ubiquinone/menaquinone biosynthesis C-methylase UbiE
MKREDAKLTKDRSIPERSGVTQQQVADDFDRLTGDYEDKINSAIAFAGMEHTFYIDVKRDHLVRLATEHFGRTSGLDVLDLGCGIGAYHQALETSFRELHGADVSSKSVEAAAQNHPFVKYESFDGVRLPYPDGRFDVVFTICVMHHVPPAQWQGFVAEMKRVLRPGGLALVFEHNPYNPATQYIVRSCDIDKDAVLLKPFQSRRIFYDAGFDDVSTRTILSVPPKGAVLSRMDRMFGRLPFGAQYYLRATNPA